MNIWSDIYFTSICEAIIASRDVCVQGSELYCFVEPVADNAQVIYHWRENWVEGD